MTIITRLRREARCLGWLRRDVLAKDMMRATESESLEISKVRVDAEYH